MAATGLLQPTGFDTGCRRGQDPSHRYPAQAPAVGRSHLPWERPWPRRGCCGPQASIQAAVGVGRPLPQNPGPGSGRGSGPGPVGAALAATGPLPSAGFDTGCRRGQDPSHRTPARAPAVGLAHVLWERPWPRRGCCGPQASTQAAVGVKTPPTDTRLRLRPSVARTSCGSSLGRDRAGAVRRLRYRLLSGQDPSHKSPLVRRPPHPRVSGFAAVLGRRCGLRRLLRGQHLRSCLRRFQTDAADQAIAVILQQGEGGLL